MNAHAVVTARFAPASFDGLPFRWSAPLAGRAAQAPLLVFLHGLGERGADNHYQLSYEFFRDPHSLFGTATLTSHPAFVIAPQCPDGDTWADVRSWKDPAELKERPTRSLARVAALIEDFARTHPVDRTRIYVTGLSMGGFGSLELAMRHPTLVAAVASICGAADVAALDRLKGMPLFLVHGAKDKVVPAIRSRGIVDGLKARGVDVPYIEYPEVGHDSWDPGYAEPTLVSWMFQQART